MKRRIATAFASLILTGCMVGPNYRSPAPQQPAAG